MSDCIHTWTESRSGESGSWCMNCGVKVFDVDSRRCGDCLHFRRLFDGSICNRHLMSVLPDMQVFFKISEGSCWTAPPAASNVLQSAPQQPQE